MLKNKIYYIIILIVLATSCIKDKCKYDINLGSNSKSIDLELSQSKESLYIKTLLASRLKENKLSKIGSTSNFMFYKANVFFDTKTSTLISIIIDTLNCDKYILINIPNIYKAEVSTKYNQLANIYISKDSSIVISNVESNSEIALINTFIKHNRRVNDIRGIIQFLHPLLSYKLEIISSFKKFISFKDSFNHYHKGDDIMFKQNSLYFYNNYDQSILEYNFNTDFTELNDIKCISPSYFKSIPI